ncbi:MAG: glutamate synthase-related protein [Anaerolineae bacterium]
MTTTPLTSKRLFSRYHIHTKVTPLPEGYDSTANFEIKDNYVKYGHPVFTGKTQRGDDHWTAEVITQTWYQAETGRIPISGAGYGGKFAGEGFDSIWLDMSEIVRPTRDGIHGRETVSTAVDLGTRPMALTFDANGQLTDETPRVISLPIPVIFNPLPEELPGRGATVAPVQAAFELGTLAVIEPDSFGSDMLPFTDAIGALVRANTLDAIGWQAPYIEIDMGEAAGLADAISERWPDAVIGARLALGPDTVDDALRLIEAGVRVLHLQADEVARDTTGDHLPFVLRRVHEGLVDEAVRDQVTVIVSGGIAAAEHVAKSIAWGADLVAIDFAMLVAWGTSLWADRGATPIEAPDFKADWGAQRLLNLMNAWRDQLLEALGAMGMREVRRLRGEIGRTIWQKDEEEKFRAVLGGSVPEGDFPRLSQPEGAEGDYRWPVWLLLTSQQQSKSGRPPAPSLEYRVGASDGGFDRMAFAFETATEAPVLPTADPADFDLSIPLNRRSDGRPERRIPMPWYGAGMSYGSISFPVMLSRAMAAKELGIFMSTGEGGYPDELAPYAEHIITQVATGLFGVTEATLKRTPIVEIKYAQGAKPGLGGHLLGGKNTESVAKIREAVQGTSLFSPFPFHSVYSVEDHKKHVDWFKQTNDKALVSVKVSTPTDVDMVAVGSYYAGAHIIHLDGSYGGTGAAPEISKKNIAMPIEYAIPKVHRFLEKEGIRDEVTLIASGGLRTPYDVAKAIALGADGAVIGTAELVAIGCIRVAQCEKGMGCPFGITTTDPEHAKKIVADQAHRQIINLYTAWTWQLAGILGELGMAAVSELRGRSDLLR